MSRRRRRPEPEPKPDVEYGKFHVIGRNSVRGVPTGGVVELELEHGHRLAASCHVIPVHADEEAVPEDAVFIEVSDVAVASEEPGHEPETESE